MIIITVIIIAVILSLILYDYYVHHTRNGQLIDLIPGPPHIPLVGSLHLILGSSQEKLWRLIYYYTNRIYPIGKVWLGPVYIVTIRHPDDLQKVLSSTKHISKNTIIYNMFRPWINDSLFISEETKWHSRRKILTPTFHFVILQQFVDIMIKESTRMVESLKNDEGIVIKDLVLFISETTLNIICETAMGTSLDKFGTFKKQYLHTVEEIGQLLLHRLKSPWLYPNLLFALSPTGRKQAKLLKTLHRFTEKIITERKLYHEQTNGRYLKTIESSRSVETDDVEMTGNNKKRLAMLDLLIAASQENHMTDLDIRGEVHTFIFAGHDTTAMSVCFSLLLLAEHKDIQDRVRTEIDDAMKESKGNLTMVSLQRLHYLERCLKEALRLYPAGPSISRVISEDIKFQSYTVPANTVLHLNIYDVHRDPKFWSNPDLFDPDRFLPDQVQNQHPYSYLPFSAGLRNCIGQRFAMLEMKTMVGLLVHNFYLEPVDFLKNLRLKTDITLRPAHQVHIKFVPISKK